MPQHKVEILRTVQTSDTMDIFAIRLNGVPMLCKSIPVSTHNATGATTRLIFSNKLVKTDPSYRQIRNKVLEEIAKWQGE